MKEFRTRRLILLLAASVAASTVSKASDEWIPLFNGRDLEGWTVKVCGHEVGVNVADTFRVEKGLLKIRYDKYEKFGGKFGHLFYNQPFSNYVLRVEYRFVGEQMDGGPGWAFRNSGVMLHAQSPFSMGVNQSFPVSVEAQMLGGDGTHERSTANVCTPGTHIEIDVRLITAHCTDSSSPTFHGDEWVTMELEVRGGGRVTHRVEGQDVLTYEHPQLDPDDKDAQALIVDGDLMLPGGYVALQAESHPLDIRRVELRVLDDGEAQ